MYSPLPSRRDRQGVVSAILRGEVRPPCALSGQRAAIQVRAEDRGR